jgi:hypothetical protein
MLGGVEDPATHGDVPNPAALSLSSDRCGAASKDASYLTLRKQGGYPEGELRRVASGTIVCEIWFPRHSCRNVGGADSQTNKVKQIKA